MYRNKLLDIAANSSKKIQTAEGRNNRSSLELGVRSTKKIEVSK
jgi:hypothetical protein